MDDVVGHRHPAHQVLQLEDAVAGQHGADLVDDLRRGPAGDLELFLEGRILDEDLEHEAILLGLGQRIRAFLLDRVLRRQHEERIGELVAHPADRDLPLLHGFEQCRLRLGRRAVDFIGENDVREQRPLQEAELALAGRAVLLDHLGAGDVRRHQVGRELDTAEIQ